MKRILIFYIAIIFLLIGTAFSSERSTIYTQANTLYENEKYEEAINLYENLIKKDSVSSEVYYNLGNSYFKLKKIGKAIINYEKALRITPRDKDIKLNLKIAETMKIDKIKIPEKGFMLKVIMFPYYNLSLNELTLIVSFLYLTIIFLIILSFFMEEYRLKLNYASGIIALFLILFGIFFWTKIYDENITKKGIIITKKADVKSGPKKDYLKQFSLHEGTKITIIKERNHWLEIELSKDLRGWIPKDIVDIL